MRVSVDKVSVSIEQRRLMDNALHAASFVDSSVYAQVRLQNVSRREGCRQWKQKKVVVQKHREQIMIIDCVVGIS